MSVARSRMFKISIFQSNFYFHCLQSIPYCSCIHIIGLLLVKRQRKVCLWEELWLQGVMFKMLGFQLGCNLRFSCRNLRCSPGHLLNNDLILVSVLNLLLLLFWPWNSLLASNFTNHEAAEDSQKPDIEDRDSTETVYKCCLSVSPKRKAACLLGLY